MNHELAKTLTTALVQFIDRERSEGTMFCSNEEWESLEYHIRNNHFDDVEAFIQKKLSKLTEFEQFMDGIVDDAIRETYSEDGFKDICKDALALAKKELARRDEVITLDNLPPYDKGFQDGKAEALKDLPRWKIWENGYQNSLCTQLRRKEMIQKLEYITGNNGNGNVYGAIPSDAEIIDKINEIIDVLNQMLGKEEKK